MYNVEIQQKDTQLSVLFSYAEKEDVSMDKNIIEITPDKDGKLFITLYGTRYQIVVKEQKPAKTDK